MNSSRILWIASMAAALTLPIGATAGHGPGHGGKEPVQFTVTIENVSTATTLRSAKGETAPAPNSPGIWVVHTKSSPLFKSGKAEMGWGLEAQAEDGDPTALAKHCSTHEGVSAVGVFTTPVGDSEPGPALPGKSYTFTVGGKPGDRLSIATMFGQSNDLFYAPEDGGIALFQNGRPVAGDVTVKLVLWDAGTEVNEEPGFGPNQAPRQAAKNTGAAEKKPVAKVKDGFAYPKVTDVLRVTITPTQVTSGM